MADQLLPDFEVMNHLAAAAAVRELPDDADFGGLKQRELARPKGSRPGVIDALNRRLGIVVGRDEGANEGLQRADGTDARHSSPSDPPPLPEVTWYEVSWAGHPLFKCRLCPEHQTFDRGVAYEHAKTHQTTKRR